MRRKAQYAEMLGFAALSPTYGVELLQKHRPTIDHQRLARGV